MLVITGTIKLKSIEEFERVKTLLAGRTEKSRVDVGNIDYVFSQSIEDPTEIRLIEKWESEDALNAHLQIPDDEFSAVIGSAKLQSAAVVSYEVTSERTLLERYT